MPDPEEESYPIDQPLALSMKYACWHFYEKTSAETQAKRKLIELKLAEKEQAENK